MSGGALADPPEGAAVPSVYTRWGAPLAIVWAGLLLSAWVYSEAAPTAEAAPLGLVLVFLGTPSVSVLALVFFRAMADRNAPTTASSPPLRSGYGPSLASGSLRASLAAPAGRIQDLVLVWVMTFFFLVHATVLAVAIGLLESTVRVLPLALGVLLFGLGPLMAALEPGSPMGIRTKETLGDEAIWRRTHRFLGRLFLADGVLGLGSVFAGGRWPLIVLMVLAVGSVLAAVARARSLDDPGSGG